MRELKVLILEDQESDVELAKYHLSTLDFDYTFEVANSQLTFLDTLNKFTPDIILSDFKLDGYDGVRAIEHCNEFLPDVPVIIVTGTLGEELAVEIMKKGAYDFVLKNNLSNLPLAVVKTLREANEKKEKQKALEQTNMLFSVSVDMIAIVGKNGDFINVNESFEKILGFSKKDISSKNILEFVHPEDVAISFQQFEKLKAGVPIVNFVNRYRSLEGNYIWLEWNAQAKEDLLFFIARDITKRKQQEEEILKLNNELENKVKERTKELSDANRLLKDEVLERVMISRKLQETHTEIQDSINYAKKIQSALLSRYDECLKHFSSHFAYWKPKSIVSGDIYWCQKVGNYIFVAGIDCTGHGVPGAMMSMMASSILNKIIITSGIYEPKEILYHLDGAIIDVLNQENNQVNDGMDMSLCRIDIKTNQIVFAGANQSLYYYNNSLGFMVFKGNRVGIGGYYSKNRLVKEFTQEIIKYESGDYIYFTSDGYYSQFHHTTGKMIMKSRFIKLLEDVSKKTFNEQQKHIDKYFVDWKGNEEQIDDVMVIGIQL